MPTVCSQVLEFFAHHMVDLVEAALIDNWRVLMMSFGRVFHCVEHILWSFHASIEKRS